MGNMIYDRTKELASWVASVATAQSSNICKHILESTVKVFELYRSWNLRALNISKKVGQDLYQCRSFTLWS
jgi:hypothetical protein